MWKEVHVQGFNEKGPKGNKHHQVVVQAEDEEYSGEIEEEH
jgi:hypothetical protein